MDLSFSMATDKCMNKAGDVPVLRIA